MTSSEKSSLGRRQDLPTKLIGRLLSRLSDCQAAVSGDLSRELAEIQAALDLTACALLETKSDPSFDGLKLSPVSALGVSEENAAAGGGRYVEIPSRNEVFGLLKHGQWLPLGGVQSATDGGTSPSLPALERIYSSQCDDTVAFPLLFEDNVIGLLILARSREKGGFSEELLDFGQVLARLFSARLCRNSGLPFALALNLSQQAFEQISLPAILLDRRSLMIVRLNKAAGRLAADGSRTAAGQFLGALLTGAPKFVDALQRELLEEGYGAVSLNARDLENLGFSRVLCSTLPGQTNLVVLLFLPSDLAEKGSPRSRSQDAGESEDWTRRLGYERWLRQTVCKLHASLDRDHLLQTLADSLGRAFKVTRCLVIRTDLQAQPMVTHEYVEPDLSPLGLGRTGQFPMSALRLFHQKAVAYSDVQALFAAGQLTEAEVEDLHENGIVGLAGAPLLTQGVQYGVCILVIGNSGRTFSEEDLETIELTASQAAVALSHCQAYHQAKDQLFHMNLLGNLTQQLTNALEVARNPAATSLSRAQRSEDKGPEGDSPPLSSREMEVLCLIASGYANREIAQRLFLTESTVELHASRIRKKLHLKSRTALVKYACDNSLV